MRPGAMEDLLPQPGDLILRSRKVSADQAEARFRDLLASELGMSRNDPRLTRAVKIAWEREVGQILLHHTRSSLSQYSGSMLVAYHDQYPKVLDTTLKTFGTPPQTPA